VPPPPASIEPEDASEDSEEEELGQVEDTVRSIVSLMFFHHVVHYSKCLRLLLWIIGSYEECFFEIDFSGQSFQCSA
jgi:hypothetical protein